MCEDCTIAECNGDYSGMDDERQSELLNAFESLATANIVLTPNFDSNESGDNGILEFTYSECDCCGTSLGGSRHRFAMWKREECLS